MKDSASRMVARTDAPIWRYAMAAATTATIHATDPTMATTPGSPTITLSPRLWIASATAGRWRTGRVVAVLDQRTDGEPDHALSGP
jgi:hypothetical protein